MIPDGVEFSKTFTFFEELIEDLRHFEDCDFKYSKEKYFQTATDLIFRIADDHLILSGT